MDKRQVWIWVGVAVAVVIIAAGLWYFTIGGNVTVPNVVGEPSADAVRTLQAAGFTLGTTTPATDSKQAPGTIVSQDPAGGSSAKKGTAVSVTVAKAEPTKLISVPNVKGQEASAAADALTAVGLVAVPYSDFNAAPAGQVFGQVPTAGSEVAPGTTIAIGVSRGTAPTNPTVPNVVGQKRDDATAALTRAGFTPKVYEAYNSSVAAGLVVSQFPAANTSALAGAEVAIEVSKGKAPTTPSTPTTPANVTVPNVTGKSEADASSALKSAGLGVETYHTYSESVPKGSVAGQLPKAGDKVAPGTMVGLAISDGKKPVTPTNVTVPDLVGKNVTDAEKALTDLGLKPVVVPDPKSTDKPDTVISQLPAAGSSVAAGTEVAIVVAGSDVKPIQPLPY